jgi:hypothetical protein
MSGKIPKMNAESSKPELSDDRILGDSPGNTGGGKEGGIVERAIRRLSDRRDLVVWEGEPVEPGPALASAHDSASARSEALRSLRTELLMRGHDARRPKPAAIGVPGLKPIKAQNAISSSGGGLATVTNPVHRLTAQTAFMSY